MLDRILALFPMTACEISGKIDSIPSPLSSIFTRAGGATLAGGFYRFHTAESAARGNDACGKLIKGFNGRFHVFAFDWMGRELAVDLKGGDDGLVICVDPGGGEYLKTDCPLSQWHDAVASEEDPLAYPFYREWREAHPKQGPLGASEAIGYKVPLFLGGADDIQNLEVCDREVYFDLCTQLAHGARQLPERVTINSISIL